jgi:hypothetical protein
VVGGEFVQEDDRRSRACFFEVEPDVIAADGIGHLLVPLVGPDAKIAVNAGVRNEPESIIFVTESSRNNPESASAQPHRVLLSPYRASHYDHPDVG